MTHDERQKDAAAHALDALDAREREAFERALAQDPALADELARNREVAERLGAAAQPVAPPAALRDSILSAITDLPQEQPRSEQDPQTQPVRMPEERQQERQPVTAPQAEAESAVGAAERRANARWFRRPGTLVAAAAVAALLVFSGGAYVGSLVTESSTTAAPAEQLAQIYAADDMQRARVSSDGVDATLVWSAELKTSAIVFDEVPPLDDDTVYEAWYINDAGAVAAGTFDVRDSGATWHVLDGAMEAGDVIGVTVEPEGGSEQPTSDPIVAIESS